MVRLNHGSPTTSYYTSFRNSAANIIGIELHLQVLECKDMSVPPVTHISGQVNVTANSEVALKVAIKNHAPSVVIVDAMAKSFIFYKSGILRDKRWEVRCSGQVTSDLQSAAEVTG